MINSPQLLHIRVTYNKNKFFKQPLLTSETDIVSERCVACGEGFEPVTVVCGCDGYAVLERGACGSCGFTTFTRMPDGDWFEQFYRSGWDLNRGVESIQEKIETPYEPLFEILTPPVAGGDSRVLEIGTGYGRALNRLRQMGVRTPRGIEASEKRQQVCRDSLGLEVSLVTSEKMESVAAIANAAPYDVIFSWHVIEHVVDLDRTFATVARLLRPGGAFVIGLPNVEHEHLIYLAHFLPHIHSFTPRSLTLLLARHGFEVEHIDDGIRVVAWRVDRSVAQPAVGEGFPTAFGTKMARDLDLPTLTEGDPFRLDYRVLIGRSSAGTAHLVEGMSAGERLSFGVKRIEIGCAHNLRPILHPRFQFRNAIDPANAAHWLAARAVAFAKIEFGGIVEQDNSAKNARRLPIVRFVYPGSHGFTWIK